MATSEPVENSRELNSFRPQDPEAGMWYQFGPVDMHGPGSILNVGGIACDWIGVTEYANPNNPPCHGFLRRRVRT